MTAQTAPNRRESHKAMEEKMTTARRVLRLVKAGRPPSDTKPGLIEAVHLGRSMANKLYKTAAELGLGPKDVLCVFVCAHAGVRQTNLLQILANGARLLRFDDVERCLLNECGAYRDCILNH